MKKISSWLSSTKILTIGLVLIGIVLRLKHYFDNRSLWMDEASLAHIIIKKSASDLAQYIGYNEHFAPATVGFALLSKWMSSLFVPSEFTFRFFPLIFGLCGLFIFIFYARQYVSRQTALICLGIFVVCEPMVYYAAELRPYTLDVLITLTLYLFAFKVWESKGERRDIMNFCSLCAITVWYSFPAIFTVVGLTGGLLLFLLCEKEYVQAKRLVLMSFLWAISYLVFQLLARKLIYNAGLKTMVPGALMPWTSLGDSLSWMGTAMLNMFKFYFSSQTGVVAGLLTLAGGISFCKRDKHLLLLLSAPLIICYMAAMAQIYPFIERRILFLLPLIIIFIGEGIVFLSRLIPKYAKPIVAVLLLVLLFSPVKLGVHYLIHPRQKEETRPVMQYLRKNYREGDAIYMNSSAQYGYGYYHGLLGFGNKKHFVTKFIVKKDPHTKNLLGLKFFYDYHIYNAGGYLTFFQVNDEVGRLLDLKRDQITRNKRTWLMISHLNDKYQTFALDYFNSRGKRLDSFHAYGASIYLYDLSGAQ